MMLGKKEEGEKKPKTTFAKSVKHLSFDEVCSFDLTISILSRLPSRRTASPSDREAGLAPDLKARRVPPPG